MNIMKRFAITLASLVGAGLILPTSASYATIAQHQPPTRASAARAAFSAGDTTGGPVVFDPASGNLEVYAVGTDRRLYEKAWNGHWSTWIDLGGSITGTPWAVYDTLSGHLEVYARGSDGRLYE